MRKQAREHQRAPAQLRAQRVRGQHPEQRPSRLPARSRAPPGRGGEPAPDPRPDARRPAGGAPPRLPGRGSSLRCGRRPRARRPIPPPGPAARPAAGSSERRASAARAFSRPGPRPARTLPPSRRPLRLSFQGLCAGPFGLLTTGAAFGNPAAEPASGWGAKGKSEWRLAGSPARWCWLAGGAAAQDAPVPLPLRAGSRPGRDRSPAGSAARRLQRSRPGQPSRGPAGAGRGSRYLVIAGGRPRIGIVALDILIVTPTLRESIRARAAPPSWTG